MDRRRVFELLEAALEIPPAERPAALDELCAADPALRRPLEALLALEAPAEEYFAEPVIADGPAGLEAGGRLGPYRIVERIGRGGMGAVYRATRETDFEKPVAIKVIRRDLPMSLTARRFQAERQILARLEHPGIARLLDGGTTAGGRPYLVMEYVAGVPIDEYCDAHSFDCRRRLELFLQVLDAVAYAHRNLVVHRDLKSGNILVTPDGAVKLLDFGIAKLLAPTGTPASGLTLPAMTLRYASPEQVRREPITTASDVYSLGVVLYQLLTGQSPYGPAKSSWAEMVEAVCEQPPPRPSGAVAAGPRRRRLAGDLDAIMERALRKQPQRRYGTVEQLAADVRRLLEDRPVRARRGTWIYRFGKLARRRSWAVAAVALILVFSSGSTVLWLRAESERAEAVREQARAERVSAFLVELFRSADPDAARGDDPPARQIVDQARARLSASGEDRPELEAELAATLARVYRSLGLRDEAVELLERSADLRRRLHAQGHPELRSVLEELARARREPDAHR